MLEAAPADRPNVLVADDDEAARKFLREALEQHGINVVIAENGRDALTRVLAGGIDLVLLDVVMPVMGGLECCRLIKAQTASSFLPVILLTVQNDSNSRVEGLRIGADDYVGKPFDEREVVERVSSLLQIKKMHAELTQVRERLEELAVHDELTGLHNYRYLHSRLRSEFKRSERYRTPLACIMIDIDGFERINTDAGREVGDRVLFAFAARLKENLREVDVVARYGGEEFLLLLPQTDLQPAMLAAERIRSSLARTPLEVDATKYAVTFSAGVSVYPAPSIDTKDELLKEAERALFRAKSEGQDRVIASA